MESLTVVQTLILIQYHEVIFLKISDTWDTDQISRKLHVWNNFVAEKVNYQSTNVYTFLEYCKIL